MGEPTRTRKGKLAGRGKHDAGLSRVVQVNKRAGGNPLIFSNYDETKSKVGKNKKNESKKKASREQSVR